MSFAPGGKKTDNSIVLSKNYTGKSNNNGKPSTGKPGPSLGFSGYLHTLLTGKNMIETLWLNLFTQEQISDIRFFSSGIGVPPWEKMPEGEDCETAKKLKNCYMGRLVPMSRFVLLEENGLHYSEGIAHPSYKEGGFDLTIAVDSSSSNPKVLWVDPEKRPWRQLVSLLSFFSSDSKSNFDCRQLRFGLMRAREAVCEFGIWSGGINVSSNAGEQYVTGKNDFVESEITLHSDSLGHSWFHKLKEEMTALDDLSRALYASTVGYYRQLKADGKATAALATNLYWQLCEQNFQDLLDACDDNTGIVTKDLRQVFAKFVNKAYNAYCPQDTARQLDAWASNRPFINKYLNDK
jgi:CRISPR system Cascade subunit CasA